MVTFFVCLIFPLFMLTVCAPGWISFGDSCYQRNSIQTTWVNAQAVCATNSPRSHLVVINNVAEETFVFDTLLPWRIYGPVWLGCNDAESGEIPSGAGEDMWTCVDSSQMLYNDNNFLDRRGYWSK